MTKWGNKVHEYTLDLLFFRQITTFIKVRVTFVFGLHTLFKLRFIDLTKNLSIKGSEAQKQRPH